MVITGGGDKKMVILDGAFAGFPSPEVTEYFVSGTSGLVGGD